MYTTDDMEEQNVYVELRKLPTFSALNDKVKEVERAATWWETYGTEWVHVGGALLAAGVGQIDMGFFLCKLK